MASFFQWCEFQLLQLSLIGCPLQAWHHLYSSLLDFFSEMFCCRATLAECPDSTARPGFLSAHPSGCEQVSGLLYLKVLRQIHTRYRCRESRSGSLLIWDNGRYLPFLSETYKICVKYCLFFLWFLSKRDEMWQQMSVRFDVARNFPFLRVLHSLRSDATEIFFLSAMVRFGPRWMGSTNPAGCPTGGML